MHEKKRNSSAAKIVLTVVIALCVIAAAVFAVVHFSGGNDEGQQPQEEGELSGVEIKTPVGSLYYPEEWADYLGIDENTEDGNYSAVFYSIADESKIQIFAIHIGAAGNGYLMGSVKNADGEEVNVWADVKEIESKPEWTDEESDRISAMQNRVNDIMDQIYHLEGFKKIEQ